MEPSPTPSPPSGLFQLPKLPFVGQHSPSTMAAVSQQKPTEEPKPDNLLGLNLPKLPHFGQQPDSSAESSGKALPWGFKLPFVSFRAAAPEPADGLTHPIGPAQAPDVSVQLEDAPLLLAVAPLPGFVPQELAQQSQAPSQEAAILLDSSWQQAPVVRIPPKADLRSAADAENGGARTGRSDALFQADVRVPAGQPGAPWPAPSSCAASVASLQAAQVSSDPVDSETVRRAVDTLFLAREAPVNRGNALPTASSPLAAQIPSQFP